MKAMVLEKLGEITSISNPLKYTNLVVTKPSERELLIKVIACGICQTEIDEIEGRTPPSFLPIIPGHQIVGFVEEKGEGVTKFKIGDRVGIAWINSCCMKCEYCLSGLENLCKDFKATGRDINGGYAEYAIIDEKFAVRLPDKIDINSAAPLLCGGAIGYRSLKLANVKNGNNIGLMGFGSSGHLVLKLIRILYPNSSIFVFARSKKQRDFAIELGADWSGGVESVSPTQLDAIIDTTPAWKPVVESLKNLRSNGKLIVNAIRKRDFDKEYLLNIDYENHLWKEKEIKSVANVTRQDVNDFLLISNDNLELIPKIQFYPLKDANRAIKRLKSGDFVGSKVISIIS